MKKKNLPPIQKKLRIWALKCFVGHRVLCCGITCKQKWASPCVFIGDYGDLFSFLSVDRGDEAAGYGGDM